jgi:hypothetical protein
MTDPISDPRTIYSAVGTMPTTADVEDGGQAMIMEFDHIEQGDDPHMFVRLQSWQDGAARTDVDSHPLLRSMAGRRVRIVIEDLGPAAAAS